MTTRAEEKKKSRVVSGMRPTGRLHIGHYFGALENWVRLQNENLPSGELGSQVGAQHAAPLQAAQKAYECFYFIADWHALTSDYADTSGVAQNTIEIMTDYLAAGLDPAKSTIFLQSLVPEHAELHLLLSMVTPLSWLERVPTYKEALENVKDKDLHNYGFLGYPCLQTADIVIYSEEGTPLLVPVGEDQVSHVELSREIVRRFNLFYGLTIDERLRKKDPIERTLVARIAGVLKDPELNLQPEAFPLSDDTWRAFCSRFKSRVSEIGFENAAHLLRAAQMPDGLFMTRWPLTEPHHQLTKTPRIPGLDGRKMSKSYGNAITLSETDEEIRKKTKVMVTDPARKRRTDPGNPDVCPVYDWHKLFAPKNAAGEYTAEGKATLEWSATGCRTAGIGCIECKGAMAENLIQWIAPVRERRVKWENDPKGVVEMLDAGSKKARVEAMKTMERVREAVFHWKDKRREIGGDAANPG